MQYRLSTHPASCGLTLWCSFPNFSMIYSVRVEITSVYNGYSFPDIPTMAPLSAMTKSPSVMTGDFPKGCTAFSSGGADLPFMRLYSFISYGTSSSSCDNETMSLHHRCKGKPHRANSHRMRCDREAWRWWRTIVPFGSPDDRLMLHLPQL